VPILAEKLKVFREYRSFGTARMFEFILGPIGAEERVRASAEIRENFGVKKSAPSEKNSRFFY
jgi:hypothetical protein